MNIQNLLLINDEKSFLLGTLLTFNSWKYGCNRAFLALILYVGSNFNNLVKRSMAYGSTSLADRNLNPCAVQFGNVDL